VCVNFAVNIPQFLFFTLIRQELLRQRTQISAKFLQNLRIASLSKTVLGRRQHNHSDSFSKRLKIFFQ